MRLNWEEYREAKKSAEFLKRYCASRSRNCENCLFDMKNGGDFSCALQPEGESPCDWDLEEEDEA